MVKERFEVYNPKEKEVRKLIIDADLRMKDIAEHMGVYPSAITNRLKRGAIEPIIKAVREIVEKRD